MAKHITRTIASTKIVVGEFNKEAQELVAIGTLTEEGKIEEEKATKIIRKAFPTQQVVVLDLIQDEAKYKIDIETFIANAEKVEDEVEQVEQVEQVEADLSEELPA